MDSNEIQLPDNYQDVVNRFVAACQTDVRIVAAFLGGSYANGADDKYSDLDLYLITTDEAYEEFHTECKVLINLLGESLFLENFGATNGYFFIFSNGTEGEIWFGRESKFKDIHVGPYKVLLDKKEILAGQVFPEHMTDQTVQIETLRHQINWFWHELSHFIKAMGRKQLWFAYGQIEVLRQICVNLARLRYNFLDAGVGEEPYFKVDHSLPIDQLSALEATICSFEYEAMLQAALVIFRFYQVTAPNLAKTYSITYQADLERMMINQLEKLGDVRIT
jgi:predicted nucleotidyltransferase